MSSSPSIYPDLAEIQDQLDRFRSPDERKDDDAMADRPHYVLHFWPGDFSVYGRELGFATWRPGFVHPVFSKNYPNRHHGRTMPDDLARSSGIEQTKNLAGRGVACLEETYKEEFGGVSLKPFTDAGWQWESKGGVPGVKEWWAEILPRPFEFEMFDQYLHRKRYLVERAKSITDPVEAAAMKLVIWSNDHGRESLRKWGRARITAAKKAAASGVGDVLPTDRELDWLMLAGMGVPKAMAEFSNRDDLRITDEAEAIPASEDTAEVVKGLAETMAAMQQLFAAQLAEIRAPAGVDPAVEVLQAALAEEREARAAQQAQINQLTAMMQSQRGGGQNPKDRR